MEILNLKLKAIYNSVDPMLILQIKETSTKIKDYRKKISIAKKDTYR